jgi:multidrug efflux pump subunit AcrA (membrane-fusion protein)
MSVAPSSLGKWGVRLAVLIAVVAGITYAVSYVLRPVAPVVAATRGKAVDSRPGTVEVKAEFDVILKSEAGGRVKTSELEIGRKVFKNDVLVTIDPGDVDIDIERIRNELAAAKKRYELGSTLLAEELNLKAALEEKERQKNAGNYPAAEYDKDRRNYQQAVHRRQLDEVNLKLAVDTLENSLKARMREKSKMTIVAPTDAVVTAVIARVGDLIGSNAPIANLISVTRTIEAKLSEDNFAAIRLGQKAAVRFLTFGDEQYPATISKLLPSADVTTQRYSVYLDVALPEGRVVMPGLTGEVSIIISERANAVVIPARALVGDYVYVVESGKVVLRKVEKGFGSSSLVEILKGVEAGETVIVEQQDRFRAGNRVRTVVVPAF